MTSIANPQTACQPLYGTPRSPERPTLGRRLTEVSRRLGKPLLPHQQQIMDVAFEIDPETGYLAYDEVVLIGGRQGTGKSESLLDVMTYRCTGFDDALALWVREELGHDVVAPGPQRVIYAAQNADEGRLKWRDMHVPRIQASEYADQVLPRLQANREAMMWANGSMWLPVSTTAKTGGTGDTTDCPVVDEAWAQKDMGLEVSMYPTMATRPWAQAWVASMIPGLSRTLPGTWPFLAKKREIGRARVKAGTRHGTAMFDFAAGESLSDVDPYDPAVWWSCIPCLGYTMQESRVRSFAEKMDLQDFAAEFLSIEPTGTGPPKWTAIKKQTWMDLHDPNSVISGGTPFRGDRALAIEFNEERTAAWIGAAGRRADGHWHVEIIEPGGLVPQNVVGIEWVLERVLELVKRWKPSCVVIARDRPAASLIVPLRAAGVTVLDVGPADTAAACGRFYDATGEGATDDASSRDVAAPWVGVFHLGQYELDGSLAVARKYDHGQGAFTFVKRGATGIYPLYTVILAMHGQELKGRRRPKSAVY